MGRRFLPRFCSRLRKLINGGRPGGPGASGCCGGRSGPSRTPPKSIFPFSKPPSRSCTFDTKHCDCCAGFEFFESAPFCKWLPKAVHYLLAVPFLKNGHRLWLHNSEECLPRGGASSVKGAADSIVLVLQTAQTPSSRLPSPATDSLLLACSCALLSMALPGRTCECLEMMVRFAPMGGGGVGQGAGRACIV
jgi:hypothetical protein